MYLKKRHFRSEMLTFPSRIFLAGYRVGKKLDYYGGRSIKYKILLYYGNTCFYYIRKHMKITI